MPKYTQLHDAAFARAQRRIQRAITRGNAKSLGLTGELLRKLPSSIGQLTTLRILYAGHNELTTLPSSMRQLKNLQQLYLFKNNLTALPPWIGKLTQLRVLQLNTNLLSALPESLCNLTELRYLYLGGNKLTELPHWMGQLTKLEELHVENNRLKTLPESLRNLTRLRALTLHRNPLGLPAAILGEETGSGYHTRSISNPAAILDYYFRVRADKRPLNEAKLILLGRGEVGKTALVNRVVHDRFVPTSITRGIAITQWSFKTDTDTVRLHVWDFGGQEIQHATHQFFLTERSLYLVVLNGRAGAEDEDAEYWLKFVKTFGASSPTIVVLNKFKVQPFQVNRRALQEKYPFIRAFVETDCKPKVDNGRPELISEINSALANMDYVRADFPADWFRIKERLASMKKPFISFAEYRKICSDLGEKDRGAQERLARFLDDLGIAINFREDESLRDETVLNPHWITSAVYRIITNETLAERQGEMRLADLSFLPPKTYPRRMHKFIIELMRKFELCFPYTDDPKDQRYLIPELLGKEKPELQHSFVPKKCLNFRYDYRLMPEGLLPRFITRTHTMSAPTERWRTGVVLHWEGCRALVEADKQDRQVLVRVAGESDRRNRLSAVIRENFDQIHSEMNEFKPTQWVALEQDSNSWVSFAKLEAFERNREAFFKEDVGGELVTVDVDKVLRRADVPGARRTISAKRESRRPLRMFISYAHEDENWRARLNPNLDLLQREGLIELWYDLKIVAGDNWDEKIRNKMDEADLYVFLMSTDLMVSEYIRDIELPIARKRHDSNQGRLIPVIIRRCSWPRLFGDIQGLPTGGKPVREWKDKDQAFYDIEIGLRKAIDEVQKLLDES